MCLISLRDLACNYCEHPYFQARGEKGVRLKKVKLLWDPIIFFCMIELFQKQKLSKKIKIIDSGRSDSLISTSMCGTVARGL